MNETCLKLTAYFGERLRTDGRFLAEAMLDLFGTHDVATSVMLRGIEGYGPHNLLRTDQSLSLSEDPPVTVVAVDRLSKITGLVDDVVAMTSRGLVTRERARLAAGDIGDVALPAGPESTDAVKLTIYVGRQARIAGLPAYRAVCDLLHRQGFEGASASAPSRQRSAFDRVCASPRVKKQISRTARPGARRTCRLRHLPGPAGVGFRCVR